MVDKKTLLLENENKIRRFYNASEMLNKEIYEEFAEKPKRKEFLCWLNKHSIFSVLFTISLISIGVYLIEISKKIIWGSVFILAGLILALAISVSIRNQKIINRMEGESNKMSNVTLTIHDGDSEEKVHGKEVLIKKVDPRLPFTNIGDVLIYNNEDRIIEKIYGGSDDEKSAHYKIWLAHNHLFLVYIHN